MRLTILAYNLFVALKTLLFRLLGVPALVTRHAHRLWLKLARGHPHAAMFATALG